MSPNRNWIPVTFKKSNQPFKEFESIQECFRYLATMSEFVGHSKSEIYNIINAGIDVAKPHGEFTFETPYDVQARANRKTRRGY
ncbi:hypothetical protein [Paenibacillus silvisoli]|uniref:hypothetical protein n=1 Tax=Paenibacillus silvisoli TaxID=3110539 RepID=UPI002803F16E|nr:hypothetical protein [Paenibacillus silvisoli]